MAARRFAPPATPLLNGERHLPDDVLQRLLVGLPLEDHRAAASVCESFRRVITGPRFLAERRRYDGDVRITVNSACAHKNRLVVFLSSGMAFERANDGSWSPYQVDPELAHDDLVESVILG